MPRRNGTRVAVAAAIFALFTVALPLADASAALPTGASHFVSVGKFRLMDSAVKDTSKWVKVSSTRYGVKLAGRIPADTRAVVVQVTVRNAGAPGYLTASTGGGASTPVGLRTVDITAKGQTRTNMAQIRVDPNRPSIDLTFFKGLTGAVTVDLIGAYTAVGDTGAADGRFVPLTGARRALLNAVVAPKASVTADLAPVGVPGDAVAALVMLNTSSAPAGGWVAYADSAAKPGVADVSVDAGKQSRANLSVIPLDGDALVKIYASAGGKLTLDVLGYFTGVSAPVSTDGIFVPAVGQHRQKDTRTLPLPSINASAPEFTPGSDAPAGIAALAGTVYTTGSWDAGKFATRPAGDTAAPSIPMGRAITPRDSFSIAFVAEVSTRGTTVHVDKGAHLVIDVVGWYLGTPVVPVTPAAVDYFMAKTPARTLRWKDSHGTHTSRIEAAKQNTTAATTAIADKGIVVGFSGMTTLGRAGNTMLFAHRTSHGGLFRYINTIKIGATFSIKGADGRWYNYRVIKKGVTTPTFNNVLAFANPHPPITAQLVACSRPDGTPTSTAYRIVVTGLLVSVTAS